MQMTCPKCHGQMRIYERSGVTVDQCTECRGIFLDRGELEKLFEAEATWTNQPHAPRPQPQPAAYAPPAAHGAQPYGAQHSGAQPSSAQPSSAQPSSAQPYGQQPYGQQPYGQQPYSPQPAYGHHGHYRHHGHYKRRKGGFLNQFFD